MKTHVSPLFYKHDKDLLHQGLGTNAFAVNADQGQIKLEGENHSFLIYNISY